MWLLDAGRGLYVAGVVGKSQLGKIQVTEFYFEFTQNHFSHLQHQNPHPRILTRTIDLQPETPTRDTLPLFKNSLWEHCRLNVLLIHSKILSSVWRSRTRVSSIRCSLCDYNPMENWRSIRLWTHGSILPRIQVFPWCSVIATESHEYSAIKGRHQKSSALGRFLHSWHYWIWKWLGMTLPRLTLLWEAYKFSLLSVPTLSYCSG